MKKIFCALITALVISCLFGCDTYGMFNHYPGDKSTTWYCEEIDFKIEYAYNEQGNRIPQMSHLEWDGVSYLVVTYFHAGYYIMYSYQEETPYGEDNLLLYGKWHYEGDNLVFEIDEDKVFDNTFEELVFKPTARNG